MVSRPGEQEAATDEVVWRTWTGWDRLDEAPLPDRGTRVVVLAAHPDDEVLAVGGLLARLAQRGCDLLLVSATDGERSHPDSPTVSPQQLAERRTRELDHALGVLGHGSSERLQLHLPDSALAGREGELADHLAAHLAGARLLLAPWRGDGHPDHEAAGRAAARAVKDQASVSASVGAASPAPALWEYPVWAWHWAHPDADETDDYGLPWERARVVTLEPHERATKEEAVACFTSQVRPLGDHPADAVALPPAVLAHFDRDHEVVFV
jgi:LmbE family N-acetylglucosaminyl deacetylase